MKIQQNVKIYIAFDEILNAKMIIKELNEDISKNMGDYETLKKMKHYGLPTVYDAFYEECKSYVVIEHIDGMTLREDIEKNGVYTEKKALQTIRDILLTVDYLHKNNQKPVIHGDIKPENIIVGNDRTVLIDFGSVESEEGTSGFAAPERILGIKKSVESDIYSLGLLLYYMMAGKVKSIYSKITDESILPDAIDIIKKCTKKNPFERYKDTGIVIKDIEKILSRIDIVKEKNYSRIISFPGCPELGCEAAWTAAKDMNTLVIDLDILNPSADLLLGVSNFKYSIQDMIPDSVKKEELINRVTKVKGNLHVLPSRVDLESFENISVKTVEEVILKLSSYYQLVIVLCSDFIYDALSLNAIFICDNVILALQKGVKDIRRYNAYTEFLNIRQNVDNSKFYFCWFGYDMTSLRKSLASKLVNGKWLGIIEESKKRNSLMDLGLSYARNMEKRIERSYRKLLRKLIIR